MKACTITFPYGRLFGGVKQIDALDVNRRVNRGEFDDYTLINDGTQPDNPFISDEIAPSNPLANEVSKRFREAAISFLRFLSPLPYTADPSNNLGTNGARQWIGLDNIINTGYWVDWYTQSVCTALNSIVFDFGSTNITNTFGGNYIYQYLQGILENLEDLAYQSGFGNVTHKIIMPRDLHIELARIIPVQEYVRLVTTMTAINTAGTDGGILNLAGDQLQERVYNLQQQKLLPINGKMYEVVYDDGIVTTNVGSNTYSGSIYIVNDTADGMPTTYWDFNRFSLNDLRPWFGDELKTTDGGRFVWTRSVKNTCADLRWVTEPRLMHQTPFLSARIVNVQWTPLFATRSPFPANDLFYDGGRTNSPLPLGYSGESPTTPTYPGINLQ
jgi:hypothetical protein